VNPKTKSYTAVIQHENDKWIIFNLLFHLRESGDRDQTLQSFTEFYNIVRQYFTDKYSAQEILILWISAQPIALNIIVLKDILKQFQIPVSLLDDYSSKVDQLRTIIVEEGNELTKNHEFLLMYKDLLERSEDFITQSGEKSRIILTKKTIRYHFPSDSHSTGYYFDRIQLNAEWDTACFNKFIRVHDWKKLEHSNIVSILNDSELDSAQSGRDDVMVMNSKTSETVIISPDGTITADIKPFELIDHVKNRILERVFQGYNELTIHLAKYQTIFLAGSCRIVLPGLGIFNKTILQDIILNDSFICHRFVVNELEKANKFNRNTLHVILDQRYPVIFSNQEDGDILMQFSKCSTDTETIMVRYLSYILMDKYLHSYNIYIEKYKSILPKSDLDALLENTVIPGPVQPIEPAEHNKDFATKYKNILRTTGYKTACRPKTRIPVLMTETEAKAHKNQLQILKYPKEGSTHENDLQIPTQYFTCEDPNYSFPGISSLGGGNLFVPCCFNKNPRSSKAFLDYFFEKGNPNIKSGTSSTTEHIKSDNQLIKNPGDLGHVYPVIDRLLSITFPTLSVYRVGVPDKPDSLLHAIGYLLELSVDELKTRLVESKSQMPYVVNDSSSPPSEFIRPEEYVHLLQHLTNTNIIVFSKDKGREDEVDLLNPCFTHHTTFYRFQDGRPFIFLIQHWGSSPDRYTKRQYPVIEPIILSSGQSEKVKYKTMSLSKRHISLWNQVYSTRFSFSNQSFEATISTLGIQLKRVVRQVFDEWNRLRGVLMNVSDIPSTTGYLYMECSPPLPPLPIKQAVLNLDDVVLATIGSKNELEDLLKIVGVSKTNIRHWEFTKYLTEDFFVTIQLKNGSSWTMRTSKALDDQSYKSLPSPLIRYCPLANQKTQMLSYELVEKLARIFMDYVMYMYGTMKDSDIRRFINKHVIVKADFQFPELQQLDEKIEKNPELFDRNEKKLLVNSGAVRDRLYYFLLYQIQNQHDFGDSNQRFLPHFYSKLSDFQIHSPDANVFDRQVVLEAISNNDSQRMDTVYVKTSLRQWTLENVPRSGIWFFRGDFPRGYSVTPTIYHFFHSISEAISISWYWKNSRRFVIPTDVPVSGNTMVYEYEKMRDKWIEQAPMTTTADLIIHVYFPGNRESGGYVFLFEKQM
jgi:hypothetical protein